MAASGEAGGHAPLLRIPGVIDRRLRNVALLVAACVFMKILDATIVVTAILRMSAYTVAFVLLALASMRAAPRLHPSAGESLVERRAAPAVR